MTVPREAGTHLPWEDRLRERSAGAAWDRSSSRARRLVDAARILAAEQPAAEFTMAEVAARAGVPLRTSYRHFGGRDDLLLALFEEEARRGEPLLRAAVESEDSPRDRLRAYVTELAGMLTTGAGYARLLLHEFLRLGEARPGELRAALAPLLDLLDTELRAAAVAGAVRPVERYDAVVLFTSVLAHVHAPVLLTSQELVRDSADRLWAFFEHGLAPSSGATVSSTRRPTT